MRQGAAARRASPSWGLFTRCQETGEDRGRPLPLACFLVELFPAGPREPVELRFAVVVRYAPFRCDVPLLLELEQCGVEGSVVERQVVRAGLLDPPRDAVAVQRPERLERFQHHQRQRALPDIRFVRHVRFPSYGITIGDLVWESNTGSSEELMGQGSSRNMIERTTLRPGGVGS